MAEETKKPKRERIPRTPMREENPQERVCSFTEVPLGYSVEEAMREASRCLVCKKPKCVEGCPVGIDIPGFLSKVREGDFQEAANILHDMNALPAICGRVCPQEEQCEVKCVLGKKGKPIDIGALERFAADWELNRRPDDARNTEYGIRNTGAKVAVIGSGPGGLTCAADLTKMGYNVTLFESLHKA
ncbi:NAD(P)-binding protein, partial [bacterium]|nr:NAD(P)-binding protein [bacterium]